MEERGPLAGCVHVLPHGVGYGRLEGGNPGRWRAPSNKWTMTYHDEEKKIPIFPLPQKNMGVEEVKLLTKWSFFVFQAFSKLACLKCLKDWSLDILPQLVRESFSMNRMWISRPFLWFTAGYQKKARLWSFWGVAVLKLYRKGSLLFDLYVRHVQMVYSRCDILGLLEDIFSKLLGVHSFWALAMWAVKDTMVIWIIHGIRLQNRSWNRDYYLNQPT